MEEPLIVTANAPVLMVGLTSDAQVKILENHKFKNYKKKLFTRSFKYIHEALNIMIRSFVTNNLAITTLVSAIYKHTYFFQRNAKTTILTVEKLQVTQSIPVMTLPMVPASRTCAQNSVECVVSQNDLFVSLN